MSKNPIPVRGIDHVVIATSNLSEMLEFYQSVFGCLLERSVAEVGLFQLRAGTTMIDLLEVDGQASKQEHTRMNMDHLCLNLKEWDFSALKAHLHKHGVDFTSPERRYGALGFGPSIYLNDPDGNTVELKGPPEENTFWMDT